MKTENENPFKDFSVETAEATKAPTVIESLTEKWLNWYKEGEKTTGDVKVAILNALEEYDNYINNTASGNKINCDGVCLKCETVSGCVCEDNQDSPRRI